MIRSLNPVYRRDIVPGLSEPSSMRLPLNDVARFIDMEDSIYALSGQQVFKRAEVEIDEKPVVVQQKRNTRNTRNNRGNQGGGAASYVTVKSGDTLGAIARRNHTTVAKIKQLNGLRGDNIRSGKKLRVK